MADSKEPPHNRLDVSGIQAVGGPASRPWREGTLTRAAELRALGIWAAQTITQTGRGVMVQLRADLDGAA